MSASYYIKVNLNLNLFSNDFFIILIIYSYWYCQSQWRMRHRAWQLAMSCVHLIYVLLTTYYQLLAF